MDIRYALRTMRRTPGFTSVAVLSLALGIGANTAIFSLINTLLLRTLPVRHPEQLVELLNRYPGEPLANGFSPKSYEHYRVHNHVFSDLIGTTPPSRMQLRSQALELETVTGQYVVPNFFPALGVQTALGRLIGPEDDQKDVAVLSWAFWKTRFNMDPAIQGKQIVVDDVPFTVIGVTAREFSGWQVGSAPDIWLPHKANSPMGLQLAGRLKPGVSIAQARAEMSVLYRWTVEERASKSRDPLIAQLQIEVQPAGAGLSTRLRDQFAKPLLLVMAVVGLLLLIACTNMAGMLLARGAVRQHEMAVRVSLGAGRIRLLRQVLTEALLLAGAGSLVGIAVAYIGIDALVGMVSSGREPIELHVQPDATTLLFTAGTALLTGLLFGLAPAFHAFTSAPATSLREIGKGGDTRFRRLFGKGLVTAQVALSLVLLTAAGSFIRNLSNLERLDLGFRRDHVLLITLDPARSGYTREQLAGPYRELLRKFEAIPGVLSATLSAVTPIAGGAAPRFVTVEGYREAPSERRYTLFNSVAPKYFETLGTPLLAGRDFNFEDQGRPRAAIVNQAMARYYFRGGNPIGKHVGVDGDDQTYEIVGVVGDSKFIEVREGNWRTMYLNALQQARPPSQFALRTSVDPAAVAGAVRQSIRESLKTVPVVKITTLAAQVDASIVPERLVAMLSGVFGIWGAVLAAIGIYGLLAYTVARRINEIGVRMALGASRRDVVRMVLLDALEMVGVGLCVGGPIAVWGTSFAASWIQEAPGSGFFSVVVGAAGMLAVALLAAWIPVRRAARVDPMVALRYE